MNCTHTDRPNVMFPPRAPACHECFYESWDKKPKPLYLYFDRGMGKTYREHGPLLTGSDGKFYRETEWN